MTLDIQISPGGSTDFRILHGRRTYRKQFSISGIKEIFIKQRFSGSGSVGGFGRDKWMSDTGGCTAFCGVCASKLRNRGGSKLEISTFEFKVN